MSATIKAIKLNKANSEANKLKDFLSVTENTYAEKKLKQIINLYNDAIL